MARFNASKCDFLNEKLNVSMLGEKKEYFRKL